MNVGLVIEILNNLFQAFYFIGFLYLFFEKPQNKLRNIISFIAATFLIFTISNYYTYHQLTFNHSDAIFVVSILMTYSLIGLKGKIYMRVIIPIVEFMLSALCGYVVFSVFSLFGKRPFIEALTFSTAYRYLYMVVGHLTTLFIYFLILKVGKKQIHLNNVYEIITFIIIPIISLSGIYSVMIAYEKTDFNVDILWSVLLIVLALTINAVIFWIIILKISKDNDIKTELLLSEQRGEMYKAAVLDTNKQIEKTSRIKHDMNNSLKTIQALIDNQQYEEASMLCGDTSNVLTNIYTPLSTENPTLNAIMNVEIEKTRAADIAFSYNISDSLSFISSSDIVSIIGNLCDNAIEYLTQVDKSKRKMSLDIFVRLNYFFIACKNTIIESVLQNNPELMTSKKEFSIHGKGLHILQDIAQKYGGQLKFSEHDGLFDVMLVLQKKE